MRTSKYALIVALLLTGAVWYIYRLGGQNATLKMRLRASDSTLVILSRQQRAVDTLYVTDTIILAKSVTKWRELQHYDTVTVPVPADTVRIIVATADTTIKACLLTVQTCEQRVAVRDSVIAVLRAQKPLIQGKGASLKSKALWAALGAGIGYIGGVRDRP